jgi:hypothetical protein
MPVMKFDKIDNSPHKSTFSAPPSPGKELNKNISSSPGKVSSSTVKSPSSVDVFASFLASSLPVFIFCLFYFYFCCLIVFLFFIL